MGILAVGLEPETRAVLGDLANEILMHPDGAGKRAHQSVAKSHGEGLGHVLILVRVHDDDRAVAFPHESVADESLRVGALEKRRRLARRQQLLAQNDKCLFAQALIVLREQLLWFCSQSSIRFSTLSRFFCT